MNKASSLVLTLAAAVAFLSSCKPTQPTAPAETPRPAATPAPTPAATPAATPTSTPTATPAATPTSTSPAATPASTAAAPATPAESLPAASATPTAREGSASVELKDPVATVDGDKISRAQLHEAFERAVQMTGVKVADLTAEQKMEGYRQLLDELITEKLVSKAASGITVPQSEVDAQIAKIKAQFSSEEEFSKQLAQVGQSPQQLSDTIKKMLQQQHWLESQIAGKTEVTDEEAMKFYEANKAEFQQPDTVKASHILFLVNKDDSKEIEKEKLEAAKAAEARAKSGEDFEKLAKELSEEPGAKESGGDLGFFPKDRMVAEFAEAAFSQKVGDISNPVRTQFGWHIIKVTEKKPAGTLPYEEVKTQLFAYLKARKQEEAANALLQSLRSSAKIENTLPPPAATPSPSEPPAATPSTSELPATTPSTSELPTATPSTSEPSAATPSTSELPAAAPSPSEPPAATPSTGELPSETPSTSEPSAATPSASEPSAATPSTSEPPSATPPTSELPAATPSTSELPAATPSASEPPAATPPASEPSAAAPPANEPSGD